METSPEVCRIPLDVLIDGLERLAAASSVRAMPDVSIAVRTLIADLYVMRSTGQSDCALVNARMGAIVTAIERCDRTH